MDMCVYAVKYACTCMWTRAIFRSKCAYSSICVTIRSYVHIGLASRSSQPDTHIHTHTDDTQSFAYAMIPVHVYMPNLNTNTHLLAKNSARKTWLSVTTACLSPRTRASTWWFCMCNLARNRTPISTYSDKSRATSWECPAASWVYVCVSEYIHTYTLSTYHAYERMNTRPLWMNKQKFTWVTL